MLQRSGNEVTHPKRHVADMARAVVERLKAAERSVESLRNDLAELKAKQPKVST